MGQFVYEARDRQGQLVTGRVSAASVEDADRLLRDQDKRVTKLSPIARDSAKAPSSRRGAGIKRDHVILMVNQLAVMLDTGVPLTEALRGITDRTEDARFLALLQETTERVEGGEPFSKALARYPKAFPSIMIALLRASEASGTMGTMLNRIAGYLTKEQQTIKQVRGALMYPLFMFTMCIGVTVFLLTVVMPRFVSIYANRGATLPVITRFLMTTSNVMVTHWPVWLGAVLAVLAGLWFWRRTVVGRVQIDWLKLHVPVFSDLFSKLYISRGCRTMGTMIETGVSLLDAVSIVRQVTGNVYFERLWDQVDGDLRRGRPMSEALYDSAVMPDHIAQMVESGEKSGRLGQVFSRLADFAETEFDQVVKTSTQFIEPVMMVVMGGIIGFVAMALLIPIFSVGRVAGGG